MKRMIFNIALTITVSGTIVFASYYFHHKQYCEGFSQRVYMVAFRKVERIEHKCDGITPVKAHMECNDQLVEEMESYDKAAEEKVKSAGCSESK